MLSTYALQTLVDTLPHAAVIFTGAEKVITAINTPMALAWGKQENILGEKANETLIDLELDYERILKDTFQSGIETHVEEVSFKHQSKEEFFFKLSFKPLKDKEGIIYGVVHTAVDVTAMVQGRFQIEALNIELSSVTEELEAGNEELRTLNEEIQYGLEIYRSANEKLNLAKSAAGIGIFDWDLLSGDVNWDKQARTIFKISRDQVSLNANDLIRRLHPDDRRRVTQALADSRDRALSDGRYDIEYRLQETPEQEVRWVSAQGRVFFNEDHQPVRFIGALRDITSVKAYQTELQQLNEELGAANEELRVSLEELRATNDYLDDSRNNEIQLRAEALEKNTRNQLILNTIAEGLALFDQHGKTYYLNSKGHELLGLPDGSVTDRTYNDHRWINLRSDGSALPAEEHPIFIALKTRKAVFGTDIKLQLPYGQILGMLVNAAPMFDQSGVLVGGVATFTDISVLKESQKSLADREAQLQEANEELTVINEEQVAINEELRTAQEELIMTNAKLSDNEEDLLLTLEAADLGTLSLDIVSGNVSLNHRCKVILGIVTEQKIDQQIFYNFILRDCVNRVETAINESIVRDLHCNVQFEVESRQTKERKWLRLVGRTIRNEHEVAIRFYGVVIDITGEKQLEKRKDDFITIASHELKTPVTSLKASLQLIDKLKGTPDHPMIPKLILQSRKSVERVSVLIEDLLNVGRLQENKVKLNKTDFILSQLINACANPMSITGKQRITIDGRLELVVNADEHQIDQVLTNFLTNAAKYAPDSKIIEVAIIETAGYVKVLVSDYGAGIPAEKLQHLFDRYYRVEEVGVSASGLGLGLYICAEIIKRHGGEIGAQSEVGAGSTFWFTLPL